MKDSHKPGATRWMSVGAVAGAALSLAVPSSDPVTGKSGAVTRSWK